MIAKKLFTNFRVIVLLLAVLFAIIAIHPNPGVEGVTIRSVEQNSSASLAGIENPKASAAPMSRERIIMINNIEIKSLEDYYNVIGSLGPEASFTILTNQGTYNGRTRELIEVVELNETLLKNITEIVEVNETINGTVYTVNETVFKTVEVPKTINRSLGVENIGLSVYDAPSNNIRKGLDLQGGTRVLLRPEEKISQEMMDVLIDNMKQRLNIYGLSDINVKQAGDLFSDSQYILVEIAGANEEEVKDLISRQGKFEAKIGEEVVFKGGEGDITYVCRSADCSGIDPYRGCYAVTGGYGCTFRFSISLKPEAAQRQADVTENLSVQSLDENGVLLSQDNQYLNESLSLYLDDNLMDTLKIGADLKGRPVTNIQISGSGTGTTEQEAAVNALDNMKQLQTVLITGSLPVNLVIEKSDNLSAQLGEEFIKNALIIGILSILSVSLVVFLRYRRFEIFAPMVITMVSEVILILGIAALVGWNLDLAAIAGIIIAVGTGVDDQIVITDETLKGQSKKYVNWKTRFKNAFFIIMAAYFTTMVAMFPLMFAGAGMLRGFALTTMMGITIGVFITRPCFGALLEIFLKE